MAPPEIPLPSLLGKYELLEFLGGGMSHVYRARDTVIDRPVVVKILTGDASADPEAKARFLQEARVAGNIQHENIVSVFDFGETAGRPYIVMEYLKGEDLREAIRQSRAGSLYERLKIALQIAEALDYVHGRGIVHRDIKPENIHIDPTGRVKLMDFGIAKTADLSLTRTGMAMGTPYYMAPEQVTGSAATPLVDVYAYGMLLYELLTGVRGITATTMESVFYQIMHQPLDTAAMENSGAPPPVRDLVMRCTAKKAEDRPQGFAAVVETLRAILNGGQSARTQAVPMPPPSAASEAPAPMPATAETRKPPSPAGPMIRLSIITYGLVILVTVLAIGMWMWMRPPEQIPGMVYIPAGKFLSGADKKPVVLKNGFYIDETEVTNREFSEFCRTVGQTMGCVMPTAAPELPVVNVTYAMANAYAKAQGKRLPTPLEWERAARGVDGDLFPWGNFDTPDLANVSDNPKGAHKLMPGRSFGEYRGLYNMAGNAWELVEGEITPSAEAVARAAALPLSPPPTASEPWVSIRGGSFSDPLTPGIIYDSGSIPARFKASNIGFRCVKDR